MDGDRKVHDEAGSLDPEDVNSEPAVDPSECPPPEMRGRDPNDVVPVPGLMSAAEVDKRGEVVEDLRERAERCRDDESGEGMR